MFGWRSTETVSFFAPSHEERRLIDGVDWNADSTPEGASI
jgi:hypothetical protein